MQIAFCFGIRPTPLRKMLENRPVSIYFIDKVQKIQAEISCGADLNDFVFKSESGQKLLSVYRLYQQERTLEKVGSLMGLTRERVRQLLNKGTKLGLFKYKKLNVKGLPDISKEKIIEDYKKSLRLRDVAHFNNISIKQLSEILRQNNLTCRELKAIRLEERRMNCIHQYEVFVKKVGRHPSTTQLQRTSGGSSLSNKITRLWGSIHAFRREFNIRFSS
ncbi:MAG TPA: sigma factor-like helix-turn-helix DNA-binding protein [Nitrospiria bacterium]|nr:sigma factor-like helix-turn-helix DNA-binding protein [Nitrospiria bacterium]